MVINGLIMYWNVLDAILLWYKHKIKIKDKKKITVISTMET